MSRQYWWSAATSENGGAGQLGRVMSPAPAGSVGSAAAAGPVTAPARAGAGRRGGHSEFERRTTAVLVQISGARKPLARFAGSAHVSVRGVPVSQSPVRVAVTGAAGQIGYSLLFRIASGHLLGPDQPVILQLLEITPAMQALEGVVMELEDCAFPLLAGIETSDDPNVAFDGANVGLLVGSRPRSQGHGAQGPARGQRRDLHRAGSGAQRPCRRRPPGPGGGQPGQHQLPDRHEQRARTCPTSASPP